MIFLPLGNSFRVPIPLSRMLSKPAISMQISNIPQIQPANTDGRWNKLQDQNTNLYQQTLTSQHLLKDKYLNSKDNNDLGIDDDLSNPFIISNLIDKHNPHANVLVLTGTKASNDGFIYIDKYNHDNQEYISNQCNHLKDYSDYEFLYNYYKDYKNVIVVDIDNYQQNSEYLDMTKSVSEECLKRIISDKKFGNVSSIVFAWAKSEQTNSLLDAIQSIDCDVLKSNIKSYQNEHEFKMLQNNYNNSKMQLINDLISQEKALIKREFNVSQIEELLRKRRIKALIRYNKAAFNLDCDNLDKEIYKIKTEPQSIERAQTLDLRCKNILNRQTNIINREQNLKKQEVIVTERELNTILIEQDNNNNNNKIS